MQLQSKPGYSQYDAICVAFFVLNAAKTKRLHMLIDHCGAEHLEDAYTSLKTESSSYVSQQSCSSGEKDISLRLLVSIQLLYKALIETL